MQPDEQPEQQQQRGRGRRRVQVTKMNRNFPELRIKSTLVQVRDQEHNMSSKTDLMMSITADIFFTNGP